MSLKQVGIINYINNLIKSAQFHSLIKVKYCITNDVPLYKPGLGFKIAV